MDEMLQPPDHDHKPVQHRDALPPWCGECGLTAGYRDPKIEKEKPEQSFVVNNHNVDAPLDLSFMPYDQRVRVVALRMVKEIFEDDENISIIDSRVIIDRAREIESFIRRGF
jgi:hypothetical protein